MKRVLTYLLLLIGVSCTEISKAAESVIDTSEKRLNCGQYLGYGQLIESSYNFCSTVPIVIEYSYKTGKWKFWDKNDKFISEVEFSNKLETITDHGGCNYDVILDTIISSSNQLSSEMKKALETCICNLNEPWKHK